jgi:hypothetical protein
MNAGKITSVIMTVLLGVTFATAGEQSTVVTKDTTRKSEVKAQTTCPVMGGKINKKLFVDVKGYRIYVCCNGCVETIKADPDKYIDKIKANGETPEKVPEAKKEKPKEAQK